jgi:hypothetical protein
VKRGLALAAALLAAPACGLLVSVRWEPLLGGPTPAPAGDGFVELWEGDPPRPYREVAILRAEGRKTVDWLEHRMRLEARSRGVDGVIHVRSSESRPDHLAPPLRWLGVGLEPVRRLEGTAVVFTDDTSLSDAPVGTGAGGDR